MEHEGTPCASVEQMVDRLKKRGISGANLIYAQKVAGCMSFGGGVHKSEVYAGTIKGGDKSDVKVVALQYITTGSIDLTPIMKLICSDNTGITHGSILVGEQKADIILNVTIDSNHKVVGVGGVEGGRGVSVSNGTSKVRFANKVSDSLKTIGLGTRDTTIGMDIQKYMINISQDQPIPQWRVEPGAADVVLHADNITELDLFHIKPLLNRWDQITRVMYSTRAASKAVSAMDMTYPFVCTMSFTYTRSGSPQEEEEEGDEKTGKRYIEDDGGGETKRKKWLGIF